jgi:cytochrome P450
MISKSAVTTGKLASPPGPRGYPMLGILPMLLRNPLEFLTNIVSEYGDIVSLPIGSQRFYLLNNPDCLKHVLQTNNRNYQKGINLAITKQLLGNGLFNSEGDFWLQQRRLVQPAFHHQRIAGMATIIASAATDLADRWQTNLARGEIFDIGKEMRLLTRRIVVTTMFSSTITDEETDTVGNALEVAFTHIGRHMWLAAVPDRLRPGHRQFQQAVETIDDLIYRLIDERRRSRRKADDLLAMLLDARDEETGSGMSDQQLRDEIMTIFVAGHETIATTLTWFWHLLAQHPEIEHRLRAELDTVLNGRAPTFQDLPRLTYTKMVIEEVMRFYPVVWILFRTPLTDDLIGGYHIPANSIVMFSPYLLHRHPHLWEHPNRFDPDHFSPERAAGRSRFAYLPFSAGPRQCIGNAFAMMEAQLIVATLAQRYLLQRLPEYTVVPSVTGTLHPRYGLQMKVKPRL